MKRRAVHYPHRPPPYPHLMLNAGERVRVERRDEEWPEFLWCVSSDAVGGWVHESFLRIDGLVGILIRPYDSVELSVDPGDQVQVLDEKGGWCWSRSPDGAEGWVPVSVFVVASSEPPPLL
jgi:hypothetical protein